MPTKVQKIFFPIPPGKTEFSFLVVQEPTGPSSSSADRSIFPNFFSCLFSPIFFPEWSNLFFLLPSPSLTQRTWQKSFFSHHRRSLKIPFQIHWEIFSGKPGVAASLFAPLSPAPIPRLPASPTEERREGGAVSFAKGASAQLSRIRGERPVLSFAEVRYFLYRYELTCTLYESVKCQGNLWRVRTYLVLCSANLPKQDRKT